MALGASERHRLQSLGIGAAIRVAVETADGSRTVYAHVNSGGSFGGSSLEQEIGLGRASRVTSLSVRWPSGLEQFLNLCH